MASRQVQQTRITLLADFWLGMWCSDTRFFANRLSRYGYWGTSTLKVLDSETGEFAGYADFSFYFPWDEPLNKFNLMFHGSHSQYLNKKHALKECLTERALTAIRQVCQPDRSSRPDPEIYQLCYGRE
jgi:hypothetical protein